jgi:hypothetical protein
VFLLIRERHWKGNWPQSLSSLSLLRSVLL